MEDQEPRKKKKRDLPGKMGLDKGSVQHAPAAAKPGLFPGSAEAELNSREDQDHLGSKIREKIGRRSPNGR